MKKTEIKHVWENKIPSNVEYLIGIDCGTHTGLAIWNMAKQ